MFCGRIVKITQNDKAVFSNNKLWDRLIKKANRQVQAFSHDSVPLSEIEKNSGFGRRANFIMADSRCLSLAEGNIIDILKNTKKDLTNNQLIVPGPEKLRDGYFYKKTALYALDNELKKLKDEGGKAFDLKEAMHNLSVDAGNSSTVVVPIPVPNNLNLENIIIVATPKSCDDETLNRLYEQAIGCAGSECRVKKSAPPHKACFLIPIGTGNSGRSTAPDVCAEWASYLSKVATPATVVCYDSQYSNFEKLFDKINRALKKQIKSKKETLVCESDGRHGKRMRLKEVDRCEKDKGENVFYDKERNSDFKYEALKPDLMDDKGGDVSGIERVFKVFCEPVNLTV